ncbi:MAG: UDP-N-acetylmuramate dehydrogenase [Candidatus Aminicenantales bacterium]
MNIRDFCSDFEKKIGRPVEKGVLLSRYSNFRIGGEADLFFEAGSLFQLKKSIELARQHSIPFYLIGGGYNLLFDDQGFRGLIIKNSVKGIKLLSSNEVEVLAGTSLEGFLTFLEEHSFSGFEFLAGIPGSVGGALFGNAGAFNRSVGEFMLRAVVLDREGRERTVDRDSFRFQYRKSILQEKHETLLVAVFSLHKGERQRIRERIERNLKKRVSKHPPPGTACAGSYFKNPVLPDGRKLAAGELLERAGAKGLRVGGATVFPGHANFIVNQGGATARDVLELARLLKEKVREEFGIQLEEEVIFLPATSSMP